MLAVAFASPMPVNYATFRLPSPFADHRPFPLQARDSREEAIANVMPLAIKTILNFLKRLSPRERAQYDLDDLSQEIWILLHDKYDKWDPGISRFTTFSRDLTIKFLSEIRNHCRVVDTPRDTALRLSNPGSHREQTLVALRQAVRVPTSLDKDDLVYAPKVGEGLDEVATQAEATYAVKVLFQAMMSLLSHREIKILSLYYGVLGNTAIEPKKIAGKLGLTLYDLTLARQEAEAKLRAILRSHGQAYTSEEA